MGIGGGSGYLSCLYRTVKYFSTGSFVCLGVPVVIISVFVVWSQSIGVQGVLLNGRHIL